MKCFNLTRYGDPEEVLTLSEIEMPVPEKDQILVKVKAAPINDYDICVTTGQPFAYRLYFGLSKPGKRFQRLGMEVAGVVEALGPEATKFEIGDEVYGDVSESLFGSISEYLCTSEKVLTKKPREMTFEDAASIPHASMLAYQGLVDLGNIQTRQKVLVNGAGGGMGMFAIAIAKMYKAEVTGVDSGAKFNMMNDAGYDHLIDYQKEDFTKNGKQYDLILDARTSRGPFAFLRSLTKGGKYVTVGGRSSKLLQLMFFKGIIKLFTGKRVMMLGLKANKDLDKIQELYAAGKVKPIIDGPHPFEKTPELVKYFGEQKHKGKIVISIP